MSREAEQYHTYADVLEQKDTGVVVYPVPHGEGGHALPKLEIPKEEIEDQINDAPGG